MNVEDDNPHVTSVGKKSRVPDTERVLYPDYPLK